MRALICLFVVASGVAAADPLPTPVAIESVTAPSDARGDDPLWKLVTSSGSPWCQAKGGVGLGEPLTITLAAPAEIARVEITTMNDGNTVASAEVTADGKVAKAATVDVTLGAGSTGHSLTVVKLPGAPVRTLVVKLVTSKQATRDVTCARSVELHTASKPEAAVLYGVSAAAAAALWPDLKLASAAFASCDKQALAVVGFPFETRWYTMDNDGMKDRSLKYRSATALATACKKHKLHGVTGMKLEDPRVNSASPTRLEVSEDGAVWDVQWHAGHWRVHAVGEGG